MKKFIFVICFLLILLACTEKLRADTPEKAKKELVDALREGDKDKALSLVSESTFSYHYKFFGMLMKEGIARDYALMLDNLKLTKIEKDRAEFTGTYTIKEHTLNPKAVFVLEENSWKLKMVK